MKNYNLNILSPSCTTTRYRQTLATSNVRSTLKIDTEPSALSGDLKPPTIDRLGLSTTVSQWLQSRRFANHNNSLVAYILLRSTWHLVDDIDSASASNLLRHGTMTSRRSRSEHPACVKHILAIFRPQAYRFANVVARPFPFDFEKSFRRVAAGGGGSDTNSIRFESAYAAQWLRPLKLDSWIALRGNLLCWLLDQRFSIGVFHRLVDSERK